MGISENDTFGVYRQKAARAAFDLYGERVANRIKKAESESEICRILTTERHKLPD